jgi:ABC-type xylose transport system substrate-binding protein
MYTNIPRAETTNIIHNILKTNQNINEDKKIHKGHNNGTKLLLIPTKILQTNRRTSNGSTNMQY